MDGDLSEDVKNLLQRYKVLDNRQSEENIHEKDKFTPKLISDLRTDADILIPVQELSFSDDETWLYQCSNDNIKPSVTNLHRWMYNEFDILKKDEEFHTNQLELVREVAKIDAKKQFDSRTFTRPKKRYSRPSIEKYNEEFFDTNVKNVSGDSFTLNSKLDEEECIKTQEDDVVPVEKDNCKKPLVFDLTQPTTSSIFDKIVASSGDLDSFQNMSPPSLVNSMCSSTFTNLMENSYIKNDPVLKEIRDTDYSETVLLQSETPMFQSFTESCSSLNSDVPESLIKKSMTNGNCTTKLTNSEYFSGSDNSFGIINGKSPYNSTEDLQLHNIDSNITQIVNNTYRKNTKINTTYNKLNSIDDLKELDVTFQKLATKSNTLYGDTNTITLNKTFDKESVNDIESDKYNNFNEGINDFNQTISLKRNSVGYPVGSADSLDHMSSLSNSSRGSNKMLNMAEVDAIVEMQEQSLQLISTPIASNTTKTLWNNCSPIRNIEPLTDSEASSNDDYATVRSSLSKPSSLESEKEATVGPRKFKSATCINKYAQKSNLRSVNTVTTNSRIQLPQIIRNSCSNLKIASENVAGTNSNLQKINTNLKGSYSNLKTLKNNLRSSYTNLKPISTNLPVAPPPLKPQANTTVTVNTTQVPCIQQKQQIKSSSLPRPVGVATGIPRPTSRIPGPRAQVRPTTCRPNTKPK